MGPLFKDRQDAGRRLGAALERFGAEAPLVLGMARGGVILAAEIAQALGAPLDVLVVRKVGAPHQPEFGIGAVAPGGICVFDRASLGTLGLTEEDMQPAVDRELAEIERRLATYRSDRGPLEVKGRTAILVDDGLATGITALAAARYVRSLGAERLVFAAPVCSRPGSSLLSEEVDEIACLETPEMFYAVGLWYEDFTQTEDEEVVQALTSLGTRGYVA